MSRWSGTDAPRGDAYDERFRRLAAAGHDVHGEASFVMAFSPTSVLDAGCGTGRVAIELGRRGVAVAGIDLDLAMLGAAQTKAPQIDWIHGDVSNFVIPDDDGNIRTFDIVLTAGNVMIFLTPGTERAVVRCLADHVAPGGHLVSGFQLTDDRLGVDDYDRACAAVGLERVARYATWDGAPWLAGVGYTVSVHRRRGAEGLESADDVTAPRTWRADHVQVRPVAE